MSMIFKIIGVVVLGALGALLFNVFLLPWLLSNPYFENYQFVKDFKQGTVVVNPKETIYIQETTAIEQAIERVKSSVVTIQGATALLAGFIASSDGNVITLASAVPPSGAFSVFFQGAPAPFKVVKIDYATNLALLKIEKNNLQTVAFAPPGSAKLGQKVFLTAATSAIADTWFANEGMVSQISPISLQTTMAEKPLANGSPLFNVLGQLVGINVVLPDGKVSAIPVSKVQELLGL